MNNTVLNEYRVILKEDIKFDQWFINQIEANELFDEDNITGVSFNTQSLVNTRTRTESDNKLDIIIEQINQNKEKNQ